MHVLQNENLNKQVERSSWPDVTSEFSSFDAFSYIKVAYWLKTLFWDMKS